VETTLYITTRNRTSVGKQVTLRDLGNCRVEDEITLLCPTEDVQQLVLLRESGKLPNFKGRVVDTPHLGAKRDWIIKNCPTEGCIVMDDDCRFSERVVHTELMRSVDLRPMIEWMKNMMDLGFVHGAISGRSGNNRMEEDVRTNARANAIHFYNVQVLRDLNFSCYDWAIMSDFYITLSLLERGLPNVVSYEYCWTQVSGGKGGCETYRTKEMMGEYAHRLAERFPSVKVVARNSISGGSAFDGDRTDVRVGWRKAFNVEAYGDISVPDQYIVW